MRQESLLLGNERGSLRGLCDRWRGWLEETGCWWSGQLCLTVACCFSALSFASSSCFCKAAWRDFISSLSREREVRNTLLAHPPHTLRGLHSSATDWFLYHTTVESRAQKRVCSMQFSLVYFKLCVFSSADLDWTKFIVFLIRRMNVCNKKSVWVSLNALKAWFKHFCVLDFKSIKRDIKKMCTVLFRLYYLAFEHPEDSSLILCML